MTPEDSFGGYKNWSNSMVRRTIPDSYDAIDKALATAIMASPASDKKTTTGVTIQSLIGDVDSLMNNIGVSFQELRKRLQSWASRHWGSLANNIFTLTKIGRRYLNKIAKQHLRRIALTA